MEWEGNDSSTGCFICGSSWGTFTNRRHHCRRCGKLVCEACSSQRLAPELFAKEDSFKSRNPKRVCDSCFVVVMKKEELKFEVVQRQQLRNELLMCSSQIRDSTTLLDVFFLDGSRKTVCYDETTTAEDVCKQACSSVGFEVALFEVLQDIDDPKQYNLLRKLSSISDILHSWRTRQLKYVKVVIPIYPRAANGDHSAKTILKSIASPNIATENDKKIPSDSLHRGRNGGDEISGSLVASLEAENQQLRIELEIRQQKIETLRATYNKKGKVSASYRFFHKQDGSVSFENISSMYNLMLGDECSSYFGDTRDNDNLGMDFDSHEISSPVIDKDYSRLSASAATTRDSNSSSMNKKRSSILSKLSGSNNKKNPTSTSRSSLTSSANQAKRSVFQANKLMASGSGDSLDSKSGEGTYLDTSGLIDDVIDPSKLYSLDDKEFQLFVRRYFHKIGELDLFMKKHDLLFGAILSLDPFNFQLEPASACEVLYNKNGSKSISSSEESLLSGPHLKMLNSNSIIHIYHMIIANDGAYEYITDFVDSWHKMLRIWLMRMFKAFTILPVTQPDKLRAVIYCLKNEQLIFESEAIDIIVSSIEQSLTVGVQESPPAPPSMAPKESHPPPALTLHEAELDSDAITNRSSSISSRQSTTSFSTSKSSFSITSNRYTSSSPTPIQSMQRNQAILKPASRGVENKAVKVNPFKIISQYMSNICNTFTAIIGDYLTVIPSEIDTLTVFKMKASVIIQDEIKSYFKMYKNTMSNGELMEIYKFLEKITKLLAKFPALDMSSLSLNEFMNDVFKQCNSATLQHVSQTMSIIHHADETLLSKSKTDAEMQAIRSMSVGFKVNYADEINNNNMSSKDIDDIIRMYTTNWPFELANLIKYQLVLVPIESTSIVKVYLSNQLLDILVEFVEKQRGILTSVSATLGSKTVYALQIEKVCIFINNHYSFASQLNDVIEKWAYDMEDSYMDKISQRLRTVTKVFIENAHRGVEVVKSIIYTDVRDTLKQGLFKNGWDDSVKVIVVLQNELKKHKAIVDTVVSPILPDCIFIQQTIHVAMCSSVVSAYLELLFTSSSPSSSSSSLSMNITTISRLSEDLEMLTKFFDDFQALDEPMAVSILSSFASHTDGFSNVGNVLVTSADISESKSAESSSISNHSPSKDVENRSAKLGGQFSPSIKFKSSNPEKLRSVIHNSLKPLRDVIVAIQMNSKFLPDFVKTELYNDFGQMYSVKVWQIIMCWRNERKEDIATIYDHMFKNWMPANVSNIPLVDLSYLQKKSDKQVTGDDELTTGNKRE